MIKTWVLVGLVGMSLVFTWYLWFGSEIAFSPLPQGRESGPTGSQGLTGTLSNDAAADTGWHLWGSAERMPGGSPSLTPTPGGSDVTPSGSDGLGEGGGEGGVEKGPGASRGVEGVARLTPVKALSPFQLLIRVDGEKQYLLTYGSQVFDDVYKDGQFFKDIGLQCPVPAAVADVSSKVQASQSAGAAGAVGGPAGAGPGGGPAGKAIESGSQLETKGATGGSATRPSKEGTGQGVGGGDNKTSALTPAQLESLRGAEGIELIFMRPIPLDQFFKAVGYDLSGPEWSVQVRRIIIAHEPSAADSAPSPTQQDPRAKAQKSGEGGGSGEGGESGKSGESGETVENREGGKSGESKESIAGRESEKTGEIGKDARNGKAVGVWAEVVRGANEGIPGGDYVRLPMRAEEVRFKRVLKKEYPTSLLAEEIESFPSPILRIPSGLYVLERPPRTGPLGITWETPTPKALESMLRSFFIDLSVLRQIEEKDGAVIYTDGRRGLRVYPCGMIEYTAPPQSVNLVSALSQRRPALLDALSLSAEFVNSHGGWLPNSLLWDFGEEIRGAAGAENPQGLRMAFSAAIGTMPVFFGHNAEPPIEVVISEEGISWYERRVPSPGAEPRGRMRTLGVQDALRSLVEHWKATKRAAGENYGKAVRVEGIYLGYFGLPNGESSEFLYPAWFVSLGDGSVVAVNANTGMVFEPVEPVEAP
ncbi:MAG TPA: hypothetical protein GX507_00835 [Clostridia bacterium]|nr:hypothetical protein [Clostridia bacterium]